MIMNPPDSAGDARDTGLILGSGRFPWDKEMAIHSSILVWEIPWTEEPGGLQPIGLQKEPDMTYRLNNSL